MAFAVLLAGSCAPTCGPGTSCDAKSGATATAAENSANSDNADAKVAFAQFMNDPTNPDSWQWLCRAAAGGNSAAQYTVAIRYRDGVPPVARNTAQSYRWFTAAIRSGLSAAVLARDELQKSIPDKTLALLRDEKRPVTEADCTNARN